MSVEVLSAPRAPGRPAPIRLLAAIAGQGLRSFLRSPIGAFFTLAFPLLFLVIITAVYGNSVIEPQGGIRVAQFFAPVLAVFGATEAAFCVLATDTALLRERGVLKRLRGSPVTPWMIIAGRIAAAVVIAVAAVVVMLTVGVAVYHVQIVWRTVPAALVTLVLGIACFAALGLAAVALTRTSAAAQALTNGLLMPMAFISNVFVLSTHMPHWLERLGSVLPLKPFAVVMSDAFNPTRPGSGFEPGHLLTLAAWTVAGALVARRFFRWDVGGSGRRSTAVAPSGTARAHTPPTRTHPGRPSLARLLRDQAAWASTSLFREAGGVFFAVVMPALLLALIPVLVTGDRSQRLDAARALLPAMAAYGIAVAAYVNMPSNLARAREQGVLKRVRGTPVPLWAHLAGRIAAALLVALLTVVLLVAIAGIGYDMWPALGRLPATALAFATVVACFSALGFTLLTLVRSRQSLDAAALGTLLPLSFISDVFVHGARMPAPLDLLGDALPLKHAVHALDDALRSGAGSGGFAWRDLAVLALWTAGGALVARRMSWQPRGQS